MGEVLIFKHVTHEGPGYLTEFFAKNAVSYRIFAIEDGAPMPTSLHGINGLVFMGGPMSVNDDLPWIEPALRLIQTAFEKDVPVLGHCLGGQLMARALGASICANPVPEYGWLPVRVSDNDTARKWFNGAGDRFNSFHWHGETFGIPDGATRVLDSEHCRNQAFVCGRSLAMQCHIEMTAELVREWVDRADDDMLLPTASIQNSDDILDDLDNKIKTLQSNADAVYTHWLKGLR